MIHWLPSSDGKNVHRSFKSLEGRVPWCGQQAQQDVEVDRGNWTDEVMSGLNQLLHIVSESRHRSNALKTVAHVKWKFPGAKSGGQLESVLADPPLQDPSTLDYTILVLLHRTALHILFLKQSIFRPAPYE